MSATTTDPRDIIDPAGIEAPVAVFLDPGYPDGDDEGEVVPPSICIDRVLDLGPEQARAVARRLLELADAITPGQAV